MPGDWKNITEWSPDLQGPFELQNALDESTYLPAYVDPAPVEAVRFRQMSFWDLSEHPMAPYTPA